MPKRIPSALLILAALALAGPAPPTPPRCRVEASYTPSFGSEFGTLQVRLLRGCPANGIARVRLGGYGGPGSTATGPTETLSLSRPALLWQTQPHWRTVLWEAVSGKQYAVPVKGGQNGGQ